MANNYASRAAEAGLTLADASDILEADEQLALLFEGDARVALASLSEAQKADAQTVVDIVLSDPRSPADVRAAAVRVAQMLAANGGVALVDEQGFLSGSSAGNNGAGPISYAQVLADGDAATVTLSLSPLEWGLIAATLLLLVLWITFMALYFQQKNSTLRRVGEQQLFGAGGRLSSPPLSRSASESYAGQY